MLYRFDNGNVYYQNILGTGNSTSTGYDTLVSAATNNPWSAVSIADMKLWHEDVSELLNDGDKGKVLVVSWYDTIGGLV